MTELTKRKLSNVGTKHQIGVSEQSLKKILDKNIFPAFYISLPDEIESFYVSNGVLSINNNEWDILGKTVGEVLLILRDNGIPNSWICNARYTMLSATLIRDFSSLNYKAIYPDKSPFDFRSEPTKNALNAKNFDSIKYSVVNISKRVSDAILKPITETNSSEYYESVNNKVFIQSNDLSDIEITIKEDIRDFYIYIGKENIISSYNLYHKVKDLNKITVSLINDGLMANTNMVYDNDNL